MWVTLAFLAVTMETEHILPWVSSKETDRLLNCRTVQLTSPCATLSFIDEAESKQTVRR